MVPRLATIPLGLTLALATPGTAGTESRARVSAPCQQPNSFKSHLKPQQTTIFIDINECLNSTLNNCARGTSNCNNTIGSYTCTCKTGYTGTGFVCTGQSSLSLNVVPAVFVLLFPSLIFQISTSAFCKPITALLWVLLAIIPLDHTLAHATSDLPATGSHVPVITDISFSPCGIKKVGKPEMVTTFHNST